jgi:hypothetical protein
MRYKLYYPIPLKEASLSVSLVMPSEVSPHHKSANLHDLDS